MTNVEDKRPSAPRAREWGSREKGPEAQRALTRTTPFVFGQSFHVDNFRERRFPKTLAAFSSTNSGSVAEPLWRYPVTLESSHSNIRRKAHRGEWRTLERITPRSEVRDAFRDYPRRFREQAGPRARRARRGPPSESPYPPPPPPVPLNSASRPSLPSRCPAPSPARADARFVSANTASPMTLSSKSFARCLASWYIANPKSATAYPAICSAVTTSS